MFSAMSYCVLTSVESVIFERESTNKLNGCIKTIHTKLKNIIVPIPKTTSYIPIIYP